MNESIREPKRTSQRRSEIRAVALRLFLQSGFKGIAMDTIRTAAGIRSKETLYRYYRSKQELFIDVVRSMATEGPRLSEVLGRDVRPATHDELKALFVNVVGELLTTMLQPDYLALMRITIGELSSFPELGVLFRENVPVRAMRFIEETVRRGQAAGLIDGGRSPEVVARLVLGAPLTYAVFDGLLLIGHETPVPGQGTVASIVESILDSIAVREK